MKFCLIALLLILTSCSHKVDSPKLTSLHLIDRNGFNELISSDDRLKQYQNVDFDAPQPYQKVSRVFKKPGDPKNYCIVTNYYENGQMWQSLEVINGRANGKFFEWHENGALHMQASVIEGVGDLTSEAKESWMFDGQSTVWDEKGQVTAEIEYFRGSLSGNSRYFHPDGYLERLVPFTHDAVQGVVKEFDAQGNIIGETPFHIGLKEGKAIFLGDKDRPPFEERHEKGALMEGTYFDFAQKEVSSIVEGNGIRSNFEKGYLTTQIEHQGGKPEGLVRELRNDGSLASQYHIKDGAKHGEEWVYFDQKDQVKLYLNWYENEVHGLVKTWYETGELESQREYSHNKKNGPSVGWYIEGNLMFIEEYENDTLVKGSYMKKSESTPVSKIEKGNGIATIYDKEGHFIKKVHYQKGLPLE